MDELIHGPKSQSEEGKLSETSAEPKVSADVYRFDESNLIEDFKTLFTKPRFFFSFFSRPEYFNQNVWAKALLVSLGLSALNSFSNPISMGDWDLTTTGLDPITQRKVSEMISYVGSLSLGIIHTLAPIFTLFSTALGAAFTLVLIRMVGASTDHLKWSSIFLIFIIATWSNIFGFLPIAGSILAGVLPLVFCTVGVSEVAHISKLRSFFAIYILPAIILSVLAGVFVMIFGALGALLF